MPKILSVGSATEEVDESLGSGGRCDLKNHVRGGEFHNAQIWTGASDCRNVPRRNDEVAGCPEIEDGYGAGREFLRHVDPQDLANAMGEHGRRYLRKRLLRERSKPQRRIAAQESLDLRKSGKELEKPWLNGRGDERGDVRVRISNERRAEHDAYKPRRPRCGRTRQGRVI
jgi:hypothetical protein